MLPPLPHLLADLVRLPSINPMGRTDIPIEWCHEARVTDYLEQHLRGVGVPVERQEVAPGRHNLIARYTPSGSNRTILFEAHQDTVPVDGMTVEPFSGRIDGGKLFGRGACDVKAGIAVMLTAFARLVRERTPNAVVLAFTVDEEHTFLGVQKLMASGVTADFAVVAEPTGLNVVNAHKGLVRWHLETTGTACHSSTPDRGVNAVYRMAKVVTALERYAVELHLRPPHPTLGGPTISVGTIRGGVSANTVPDVCRVQLDRRLLPHETAASAMADVAAFLKGQPEIDFPIASGIDLKCPPLSPTGGEADAAKLGATIDAVCGSHRVLAVPFGTDASTIQEAGIPAVVFGPGDIAQAHTRDEWIDLSQLEPAAEVLVRFAS